MKVFPISASLCLQAPLTSGRASFLLQIGNLGHRSSRAPFRLHHLRGKGSWASSSKLPGDGLEVMPTRPVCSPQVDTGWCDGGYNGMMADVSKHITELSLYELLSLLHSLTPSPISLIWLRGPEGVKPVPHFSHRRLPHVHFGMGQPCAGGSVEKPHFNILLRGRHYGLGALEAPGLTINSALLLKKFKKILNV